MKKTKPIKKIMIFAIITVMIVSLFAVPTFAVDGAPTLEELFPTPIMTQPNQYGDASLDGAVVVVITRQELDGYQGASNTVLLQPLAGTCDIFLRGTRFYNVISFEYVSSQVYSITCLVDPEYGDVDVETIYTDDAANWGIEFVFTSYPPTADITNADVINFWALPSTKYTLTPSLTEPDTPDTPDTPTDTPSEGDASGIFAVWTAITDWVIDGLASVTNAFYYNGELTLLGYLCIIPLALGVGLLLISIIQKFLRLRG